MICDLLERTITVYQIPEGTWRTEMSWSQDAMDQSYIAELDDYLEAVRTGNQPHIQLKDAAQTLDIALGAMAAADSQQWQVIQYEF